LFTEKTKLGRLFILLYVKSTLLLKIDDETDLRKKKGREIIDRTNISSKYPPLDLIVPSFNE
jgi:hypothetical protein